MSVPAATSTASAPRTAAATVTGTSSGTAAPSHGHATRTRAKRVGDGAAKTSAEAAVDTTGTVRTVSSPSPSFAQEVQNFAVSWEPVVAIVFFVALILLMWRTLK